MSTDVVVIGGGLVGASLACALAPLGLEVVLLEASPVRSESRPSYDDRTLALSLASCRILQGLGLWGALARRATAIREIQVTEYGRPGRVWMRAPEFGLDSFGHVVEAREFGAAVLGAIGNLNGVRLVCGAQVTAIETSDSAVKVQFEAEEQRHEVCARLLVGADGADSFVRTALGIGAERFDYGQTAIICNVTPRLPHRGRAWECLTRNGPFALLPHIQNRCGLIWTVARPEAEEILAWDDQTFMRHAESRFGQALGPWQQLGRRSAYDLRLVRADRDTAPRAVVLGNAAHAVHPVGAQGFNLGLRDVAVLAELLARACAARPDADPGTPAILSGYSSWRRPDQSAIVAYTDGLARLYASPSPLAGAVRHAALLAHALIPPLRRRLAVRAMGFRGQIPRLALGESLTGA